MSNENSNKLKNPQTWNVLIHLNISNYTQQGQKASIVQQLSLSPKFSFKTWVKNPQSTKYF